MTAPICQKLGAILTGSGTEGSAVVSGELGILIPEKVTGSKSRQSIIDLYDQLRPSLRAYLCCLGMDADQAEDVIQDTFLRLVSQRFDGDAKHNLRAWLFRVAHNLSMNIHRSQKRRPNSDDDESRATIRERVDPRPSPEQQILLDERMKLFEDAFAQLTPKQRQCVLLRAEGLRYREIAEALGISVQRVGELMQRSITRLEVRQ